jgi:Flp pilus assembly pilin Flp
MKHFRSHQQGQGMTEYIIVVALIAIAAIGVYTAFGKTVRGQMAVTAQALAGKSAGEARSETNAGGEDAVEQAGRGVKLDNYDQAR